MVIQCSACQTRFRLADDKIKESGTKVRCSKCSSVFTVYPPAAPAAPEPAPAAPPPAPEPPAPEQPAAAAPAAPAAPADEFADWSDFAADTEEPGQPADDTDAFGFEEPPAAAPQEAGTSLEEAFEPPAPAAPEGDGDFDFDAFSFDDADDAGQAPAAEEGFDDFDFGSQDPGAIDADAFAFEEGGGADDDPFAFEEPAAPPLPDLEEESAADFAWEEPAAAAPETGDFDFSEIAPAREELGDSELNFSEARLAPEPAAAAPRSTAPATAAEEPATQPPPPPPLPARRKYARKKRRGGRLLTWLLLLLLLGLGGAAGYFYWSGELPDVNRLIDRLTGAQPQGQAPTSIRISDLTSTFVNNRQAGQLFVIQGRAVNGYPAPRSAITVRGVLFDRAGKVLREQSVYCGNPLSEKELQSLPLARLRERSENRFGDSLSNLNLAPGKSLPFTIVFSDLPANLAEFNVEPGESIPGSQ